MENGVTTIGGKVPPLPLVSMVTTGRPGHRDVFMGMVLEVFSSSSDSVTSWGVDLQNPLDWERRLRSTFD